MPANLSNKSKAVLVSSIGGGLENYDFILYVFFAPIFAKLFFPAENESIVLLNTLAIFAIGYFARPIGAVLFGHYGDKFGRKKGMLLSLMIMGVATVGIGLLPTYATIGILAPVLLLFLRILQGISIGGDLPGAITFVAEYADNHARGFVCALVFFAVNIGLLTASAIAATVTSLLSHEQLITWGWRIGFLLGVVIAAVGYYLRSKIAETAYFNRLEQTQDIANFPLFHLFKIHYKELLQGVGLVCLFAVIIAQIFLYMPTYLNIEVNFQLHNALILNSINGIVFALCIPIMGYLSDKFGRKPVIIITILLFIILTYPLYVLINHHNFILLTIALGCFAVLSAGIVGTVPSALAELFPTHVRYTGVAIAYNISFAIFAGLTPVFATYLLYKLKFPQAPSLNLIFAAIVALIAALSMQEGSNKNLKGRHYEIH